MNYSFRLLLKKTYKTKRNTKKASLILLALLNVFDAKKFSVQGVERNKAILQNCFKKLLLKLLFENC